MFASFNDVFSLIALLLIFAVALLCCDEVRNRYSDNPTYIHSLRAIICLVALLLVVLMTEMSPREIIAQLEAAPIFTFTIAAAISCIAIRYAFVKRQISITVITTIIMTGISIWLSDGFTAILTAPCVFCVYIIVVISQGLFGAKKTKELEP